VVIHTWPLGLRHWAFFYSDDCHAVTAMSRPAPSRSLIPRAKNRRRHPYAMDELEVKLIGVDIAQQARD